MGEKSTSLNSFKIVTLLGVTHLEGTRSFKPAANTYPRKTVSSFVGLNQTYGPAAAMSWPRIIPEHLSSTSKPIMKKRRELFSTMCVSRTSSFIGSRRDRPYPMLPICSCWELMVLMKNVWKKRKARSNGLVRTRGESIKPVQHLKAMR
jgi:hypothetical protein